MSKLLKIIVNIFLVAAILVAVAILVPPLAGVTTTIVDTPSMNTNLPLGSITYSTDINVYDIQEGDEILKENDASTYAYIIEETDPANGRFMAVSAADPNGAAEEVMLRNTVSKVAVVVPYIGYIIMAMHSVEGIVIIALIVVLMIIMFILSELWKHSSSDEETDEEEEEEPEEKHTGITATEETGIDTDTIRAAVEENHTAVQGEDALLTEAAPQTEEPDALDASAAAFAAAGAAAYDAGAYDADAYDAGAYDAGEAPQEPDVELAADLELLTPDVEEFRAEPEVEMADSSEESADDSDDGKSWYVRWMEEKERKAGGNSGTANSGSGKPAEGAGGALASLAAEMEEKARISGTGTIPSPVSSQAEIASESELAAAEAEFFGLGGAEVTEAVNMRESDSARNEERFVPVSRPMLDEIVEQAKNAGQDPLVKKDDKSGISIVDISEIL